MKRVRLHIKKGFSLIELLVAMSIFLVFFTAITGVTVNSSKYIKHSLNKDRATQLAEESIEAVRNMRDEDFSNLTDGTFGLSSSGNQFSLLGLSDSTGIFNRAVTISSQNESQKRVDSTVSWSDQVNSLNSITLSTYVTNWKKITPLSGITVTKTVINHGGSMTSDDFAPYMVEGGVVPLGVATSTAPGTYIVTESTHPDYTLTFGGDCDSVGSITVAEGDAKVCTLTNEENYVPVVIDPTHTSVTQNSAILGATVSSLGLPSSISERGVCYDTTPSPTLNCVAEGGTSVGAYTQNILSLSCGNSYYYRGYAVNAKGTGYSPDGTFSTESCFSLPTVTTDSMSNVLTTTAVGGGNVTSDGGATVTERGVVWDTQPNPTTVLVTKTSDGVGAGSFTSNLSGLLPNTLYYVRAYAVNAAGTSYGSEVTFTTSSTTIAFINSASSGSTTVTIPVHNIGDLLIIFAYRDGNNTAPSLPSGWTNIGTANGANSNSSRLAYRIATATNDPSGTWTNATGLVAHVYRGQSTSTPIGLDGNTGGNGTTITYPAVAMSVSNGSSWMIGFSGHRSVNTSLETPPSGMINRTNFVNATSEVAGHDSNGGVSSWSAVNVNAGGSSSGWRARTVEIISQ